MAAILDLAQNEDLPWVDSGGLFFLFLHTSNELISGEKLLLTFLSNLSRSLLRLLWIPLTAQLHAQRKWLIYWPANISPYSVNQSSQSKTNHHCSLMKGWKKTTDRYIFGRM